jgi:hypothetical protein
MLSGQKMWQALLEPVANSPHLYQCGLFRLAPPQGMRARDPRQTQRPPVSLDELIAGGHQAS